MKGGGCKCFLRKVAVPGCPDFTKNKRSNTRAPPLNLPLIASLNPCGDGKLLAVFIHHHTGIVNVAKNYSNEEFLHLRSVIFCPRIIGGKVCVFCIVIFW